MKTIPAVLTFALWFSVNAIAGQSGWRKATEQELTQIIPARVVVEKNRVPSKMRTASGITDGSGKFIAGVSIEVYDYDYDYPYSHYVIAQMPIKIGGKTLPPGQYVFSYRRIDNETEEVKFYSAADSSHIIATTEAQLDKKRQPFRQFNLEPPVGGKGSIHFGRFFFEYQLVD
jgi:hypothetical protein